MKYLEIAMFLSVMLLATVWFIIICALSDADYCARGIDKENTCSSVFIKIMSVKQ